MAEAMSQARITLVTQVLTCPVTDRGSGIVSMLDAKLNLVMPR